MSATSVHHHLAMLLLALASCGLGEDATGTSPGISGTPVHTTTFGGDPAQDQSGDAEASEEPNDGTLDGFAFVGTFPYDGGPSPLAQSFGYLVVDEPCLYIEDFDPYEYYGTERVWLRLPSSLTTWDSSTSTLWVGSNGPMAHGDLVAAGGGASSGLSEVPCKADRSFAARSLCPAVMPETTTPDPYGYELKPQGSFCRQP